MEEKKERTAQDYFEERFLPTLYEDKHEKKVQRFDYYDMVDFAQQFKDKELATLRAENERLKKERGEAFLVSDEWYEKGKNLQSALRELKGSLEIFTRRHGHLGASKQVIENAEKLL